MSVRLKACDLSRCEARCCYDGAYLLEGEEAFLRELVGRLPSLQAVLPGEFVVDGYWDGELLGRKTATRAHDYRSDDFPAHFTRTRCVFADAAGLCELEKLARGRGQHPWTFKPAACWLHPLQVEDDVTPEPPPHSPADDPYRTATYAGYASFTPCGCHTADGEPWRKVLAAEIAYLEAAPSLPLLGSPGHSVGELLADPPVG